MKIISVAVKSTFAGHAWLAKHVSDIAIVRNNDQLGTDNNLGIPYLVVQNKNSPSLISIFKSPPFLSSPNNNFLDSGVLI